MDAGYVKLWRKSLDSSAFQEDHLWRFWCWCLMKATYKPKDVLIGLQSVHLEPGQFVFGRKSAAEELESTEMKVRNRLEILERLGNVTIKRTNKFSIISIVNWDTYQQTENENNQQNNQQRTNKEPTKNHKQEVKECKEKENIHPEPFNGKLPDWLDEKCWNAFLDHRKSKRAAMTENAKRLAIKKLDAWRLKGQDPSEILEQSILNGWTGIFEVKAKQVQESGPKYKQWS